MCSSAEKLIFCTCVEQNSSQRQVGEHQWVLTRYLGARPSNILGKIMRPSDELGEEINVDAVIEEMNARNCFDFEYVPQERDEFEMDNGLKRPDYKYFSLIFKDQKWQRGRNPGFGRSITEPIASGKVTKRE